MPFGGKKLPDTSIAKLSDWIKAGVPYGDAAEDPDLLLSREAQKHWAFRTCPSGRARSEACVDGPGIRSMRSSLHSRKHAD